jgi:hypothetical protein
VFHGYALEPGGKYGYIIFDHFFGAADSGKVHYQAA